MPRHPAASASVTGILGSVYSALGKRLATHSGEVYPLHVGDTWLEPAEGCRMEDLKVGEHPGLHRYASPHGVPALLEAIAARVDRSTGVSTSPDEVLVATGATGALGATIGALLDPGDEVLLAAPYWPLIAGIVRSFHGTPVAVPLLGTVGSADEAVAAFAALAGPRTVALYLNTPNNPTGLAIPRSWLEAIVDWAGDRQLWLISDEVYEHHLYRGSHTYLRALAPERTFSAYSFSKSYGMAGNRCGYVVGPGDLMAQVLKVATHTFYSTPTAAQIAALRVLGPPGDAWIESTRRAYREIGERCAHRLGLPAPDAGTFLFFDVADHLEGGDLLGFLERCADRGLFLAPGPSFGPYPTHVRLCFTAAPPEVVERGVEELAQLLGR